MSDNVKKSPLHVVIGGGSGFIGSALKNALSQRGYRVTLISRTSGENRITWDQLAENGLPKCNVVVNLAGQHILDLSRPWNDAYRDEVLNSRIKTTTTLSQCHQQQLKAAQGVCIDCGQVLLWNTRIGKFRSCTRA